MNARKNGRPLGVALLASALLLPAAATARTSPDLSTPESCVRSYQGHRREIALASRAEMLESLEWELRQDRAEARWFKDRSTRDAEIRNRTAFLEFLKANDSALVDGTVEVIDKEDVDPTTLSVVVRIREKWPAERADRENEFEVKDEEETVEQLVTLVNGEWRILH